MRDGDKASAWRVKDSKLQKVAVTLGDRDARTGDFVLTAGLAEGDQVIRYPTAHCSRTASRCRRRGHAPASPSMVATEQPR